MSGTSSGRRVYPTDACGEGAGRLRGALILLQKSQDDFAADDGIDADTAGWMQSEAERIIEDVIETLRAATEPDEPNNESR